MTIFWLIVGAIVGAFLMQRKKDREMFFLRAQAKARVILEEQDEIIIVHHDGGTTEIPAQALIDALTSGGMRLFGLTLTEISNLIRWKRERTCEEHGYDPQPFPCPECNKKKPQ